MRFPGLTTRALAAWAGTDRLAALPALLPELVLRELTPASAMLALFVAGATVPRSLVGDLGDLVDDDGRFVRARVAILPLGPSLLVCDRLDAADTADLVCWPDDSSHHLAAALPPGRVARWLDLGCGSAFAPLARPELATAISGVDLNPRAVRYARLGAELSGIAHVEVIEGDVATIRPAELVTCNAPIPEASERAIWRATKSDFFDRLWPAARAAVAPGGLVVIHATAAQLATPLPGERIVVLYTPEDEDGFGILWWRPDLADRYLCTRRRLAVESPHLTHRDRDDARS